MTLTDTEAAYLAALDRGDTAMAQRHLDALDALDAQRHARLSGPGALRDAALYYAAHGVAVFPLQPRDKRPRAGSKGFKDASTDPGQVAAWWAATPQANIGSPTGLTFDVLDIDGPAGIASYLTIADNLPDPIGVASTPRPGGMHRFLPVTGRGNAAASMPGIDYRGQGGYVVLPPSVTDTHGPGRRYTWLRPLAPPAIAEAAA